MKILIRHLVELKHDIVTDKTLLPFNKDARGAEIWNAILNDPEKLVLRKNS